MKAFGLIFLMVTMALAAYWTLGGSREPKPDVSANDLQRAKHIEDKARDTMNQAALGGLKRGVLAFQAEKGRWPNSLEEAKEAGYIDQILPGAQYDPQSGQVSLP